MTSIDTGPILLSLLLIGSVLISCVLHLCFKRRLIVSLVSALVTVVAIFTIDSISVGFFNQKLLLGIAPGLGIAFLISYLIGGMLLAARKRRIASN